MFKTMNDDYKVYTTMGRADMVGGRQQGSIETKWIGLWVASMSKNKN